MAFKAILSRVFSIDLRALAIFRIMLAVICGYDFFRLMSYANLFLSDDSLMPRSTVIEFMDPFQWSLNFINGATTFQIGLLGVGVLGCVLLFFGCRTKLALAIVWLIKASCYNRAPYMNQGGDTLMLCLLFWSFWLPIQQKFSVDSALRTNKTARQAHVFSMASCIILLQAAVVWYASAFIKAPDPFWASGIAIYAVLSTSSFTTTLAHWFLAYPVLLYFLTLYVLWLEAIAPILLFLPTPRVLGRKIAIFCLATMHIGFLFLLNVGHFPWVSLASICLFLPSDWLDKLSIFLHKNRQPLRIYYDEPCHFCRKLCYILTTLLCTSAIIKPAQSNEKIGLLLAENNSWVIENAEGIISMRWRAMLTLCRASRLGRLFHWLLCLKPLFKIGDLLYNFVASHRACFGRLTAWWWREKPMHMRPLSFLNNICLLVLLLCSVVWNLHTVYKRKNHDPFASQPYFSAFIKPIMNFTTLTQDWRMFAPTPVHQLNWYRIFGMTNKNKLVQLVPSRIAPITWYDLASQPTYHTGVFDHDYFRLRKYFADKLRGILKGSNNKQLAYRKAFFDYYCRHNQLTDVYYIQLKQQPHWHRADKRDPGPPRINAWYSMQCKTGHIHKIPVENLPAFLLDFEQITQRN